MHRGKKLKDIIGKNEKTKIVAKLQKVSLLWLQISIAMLTINLFLFALIFGELGEDIYEHVSSLLRHISSLERKDE